MSPNRFAAAALVVLAGVLAGCASTPGTGVHQPMTARPPVPAATVAANGSIYQPGVSKPLFEDRRARNVGDTLIINIVENTQAATKSNSNAQKTASVNASVDNLVGLPGKSLLGLGLGASDTNKFDGKGESNANNVFTGTIAVTVIEALPNGNLLVSGEKQLAINQSNEYIRFSGIVAPQTITIANTVNSTQVADARIEYKSSGYVSEAQVMGWLARFFLSFLPF